MFLGSNSILFLKIEVKNGDFNRCESSQSRRVFSPPTPQLPFCHDEKVEPVFEGTELKSLISRKLMESECETQDAHC